MTMRPEQKQLTGKKVLAWFLGFFLIVISANVIMSWFAVKTFSGVETEDAYARGRDFNDEIAKAAAQQALGWTIEVDVRTPGLREVFVTLTIKDDQGVPLDADRVEGNFVRRVHKGVDQPVTFAPLGQGRYAVAAQLPLAGQWQLRAVVTHAGGQTRKVIHDFEVAA